MPIDADDIGRIVMGPDGPEAGVGVIAETDAFQTRYAKIVVTDDQDRYVVPDLPRADYEVWVRAYGLADSRKVPGRPGQQLPLIANATPTPGGAAVVYPAAYWYSMMRVPDQSEVNLPGSLNQYIASIKNLSCIGCHQIVQLATRTLPPEFAGMPHREAWVRRIQSGQAGARMLGSTMNQLAGVPIKYLADWTERIAKGELPHATPERPRGVERNVVATVRDWSNEKAYMHDLSGTDRRNPIVNGYGKLYGAPELSTDEFPILDRRRTQRPCCTRPCAIPTCHRRRTRRRRNPRRIGPARRYATARRTPTIRCSTRTASSGTRPSCARRTMHPTTAKRNRAIRRRSSSRSSVRAASSPWQFGYDENDTLWTSGGGPVVGWLSSKMFLETGDAGRSQGWTAPIVDTNGNGKRDEYVEPNEPVDPTKDKRIAKAVRSRVVNDVTPDTGCGMKLLRRSVFLTLPYFDHMHRFLPALTRRAGHRVLCVPVWHRPRLHAEAHYGVWDRA